MNTMVSKCSKNRICQIYNLSTLVIFIVLFVGPTYTIRVPGSQPEPIPEPVPDLSINYTPFSANCPQNYSSMFTCTNGTWSSNHFVTLYPSMVLENASFMMNDVLVIGMDQLMRNVTIYIKNDLVVSSNSSLVMSSVNLGVGGNFYIPSGSYLAIDMTKDGQMIVNGTTHLQGVLKLTIDSTLINQKILVLSTSYVNGSFSDVHIETKGSQSSCGTNKTDITYGSKVYVIFRINDNCSNTAVWIWCVVGVVLCLFLILGGLAVFLIYRKKQKLSKDLLRYKQNIDLVMEVT